MTERRRQKKERQCAICGKPESEDIPYHHFKERFAGHSTCSIFDELTKSVESLVDLPEDFANVSPVKGWILELKDELIGRGYSSDCVDRLVYERIYNKPAPGCDDLEDQP
jgi:hypothetical protein